MAIFFGFTVAGICWSVHPRSSFIFQLLPILIIPFIIGLLDDLIHLKPLAKLIAQWITASLLFFVLDLGVRSDYGLLGGIGFPTLGSYAATLFAVVLITNSLNLIDGIDGLAGTFSFIASICFGTWFFFTGDLQFAILCLALAGAILAFLFKNWEPSYIFMGDTGSLVIGTILSVVMMRFINADYALDATHPLHFESPVGAAIAVMSIPLLDTTRIIFIRLSRGISPFSADKRHIHHALVRLGLSHRQTVYTLTLTHVSFIAIALLLRTANQWVLIGTLTALATLLSLALERYLAAAVGKGNPEGTLKDA